MFIMELSYFIFRLLFFEKKNNKKSYQDGDGCKKIKNL